ncbi:MAG TPA: caspase family protein [Caldilineaceae bacterium]|nr:caspase family protein [Caldilineaceae bacterium]
MDNRRNLRLNPAIRDSIQEEGQQAIYDKSWAVVVGINQYAQDLPPLYNAQNDAQAIAEILREQYHFDEVHTLYNEQATRRAIVSWLRDKLPKGTQKNDRVIFFFAGHGVTQETKQGGKCGYLAPYDAEKGEYADYIEMRELVHACSAIAAKHILMILDCCFSGVAAVGARSAPRPTPKKITDPYLRRITEKDAWQILTAGDSDDLVADSSLRSSSHSVFTSVLLDALNGEADHNHDSLFTATDLAAYVKPLVTRESAIDTGRSQTPFFNYLAGSDQGDFVFELPLKEAESSSIPTDSLSTDFQASPSSEQQTRDAERRERHFIEQISALQARIVQLTLELSDAQKEKSMPANQRREERLSEQLRDANAEIRQLHSKVQEEKSMSPALRYPSTPGAGAAHDASPKPLTPEEAAERL